MYVHMPYDHVYVCTRVGGSVYAKFAWAVVWLSFAHVWTIWMDGWMGEFKLIRRLSIASSRLRYHHHSLAVQGADSVPQRRRR